MSISIIKADPSDSDTAAEVDMLAHLHDPLFEALFRIKTGSKEQIDDYKRCRAATLKARMSGPGKYYYKAVDDSNGTLVGLAGSYDPRTTAPASQSVPFPECTNWEVYNDLREKLTTAKERCFTGRDDVWFMQTMFVHPEYQRQGIAKRLMQAGLEEVDRAGQDVYLESTPAAQLLYKKFGFEELEVIRLENVPYTFTIMLRKARKI